MTKNKIFIDNACEVPARSAIQALVLSGFDDFDVRVTTDPKQIMTEFATGYVKYFCVLTAADAWRSVFPNNSVNPLADAGKTASQIKWILQGCGSSDFKPKTVFFCADTHFNHGNIIKYCDRPWSSGKTETGELIVTPEDVEKMNEDLIANWNSTVGADDEVWFLGDFALGRRSDIPLIRKRLNGKINIVLGNHDYFHVNSQAKDVVEFFYNAGFDKVYDRPVLYKNYILLSHEPQMFFGPNSPFFNIYGHVHNTSNFETWTKSSCCVCVERHNYAPVPETEIEDRYRKLNADA